MSSRKRRAFLRGEWVTLAEATSSPLRRCLFAHRPPSESKSGAGLAVRIVPHAEEFGVNAGTAMQE